MAINSPSQYECDNMKQGDLISVRQRNPLYKWYRKNFLKDKIILNIRKDWSSDERIKVYQEDCTLLFSWELLGKCEFKNEVPYFIGYNGKFIRRAKRLKILQFGSENINIVLNSGLSILIPIASMRNGITKMDNTRQFIDEQRQIKQALKFARYKGDFFKKRCKELNIDKWDITYCSICGNPVYIHFDKENPYIDNTCECGNMLVKSEETTWDAVAYLFNSQVQQPIINHYKEFWKM